MVLCILILFLTATYQKSSLAPLILEELQIQTLIVLSLVRCLEPTTGLSKWLKIPLWENIPILHNANPNDGDIPRPEKYHGKNLIYDIYKNYI